MTIVPSRTDKWDIPFFVNLQKKLSMIHDKSFHAIDCEKKIIITKERENNKGQKFSDFHGLRRTSD